MPVPKERSELGVQSERAVLAAVRLPDSRHDRADPFGELRELARQAGAVCVGEITQSLDAPVAGTYMGSGKVQELRALCETTDASTIIFDHDLSPKQIAKIEEATDRKVIDRSELILDIFAARAVSHEAKLQVELAQLEYTYPRLRAMWSHLERIAGGSPTGIGTRGPGEQQLEIDRRLVQQRKNALTRELRTIEERKRREVRARKVDHYTVGLVGYTNAGKSTLFNALTAGGAYADDRLFATLMTRTREWDLGGGLRVMLSDTVGFVRDLPHHLVASFRATLEEATHADLLLVVLDASDPAAAARLAVVSETLDDLEREVGRREARERQSWSPPRRLLVLNKVDLLRDNRDLLVWQRQHPEAVAVSALEGARTPTGDRAGLATLEARVRELAIGPVETHEITVPLSDSRTIHVLENRGVVEDRRYDGDSVTLRVRIGRRPLEQLRSAGARLGMGAPAASPWADRT